MPMQLYSLQKVHVGKYPPVALLFSFSSLTGSFPSKGLFLSHNHNVPAHKGSLDCWGSLHNTVGSLTFQNKVPRGQRCCDLLLIKKTSIKL